MQRFRATSPVAISAYSLGLLAGAPVASADAPAGLVNTPRSATWSPSTAAVLADGDDVRALLIFDITTDQISSAKIAPVDAPEVPSLSQAMSALLADGDDIRARALPAIAH